MSRHHSNFILGYFDRPSFLCCLHNISQPGFKSTSIVKTVFHIMFISFAYTGTAYAIGINMVLHIVFMKFADLKKKIDARLFLGKEGRSNSRAQFTFCDY